MTRRVSEDRQEAHCIDVEFGGGGIWCPLASQDDAPRV
jgi:hypothetical protein